MKRNSQWMKKVFTLGAVMMLGLGTLTGCGKGGSELKDFSTYAQNVVDITIPEEVRIVALGEATHGNKEFQELKLDVFAHLVETTDVRAFALEGDFGGCAKANKYILHNEGTAEEAVKFYKENGYNYLKDILSQFYIHEQIGVCNIVKLSEFLTNLGGIINPEKDIEAQINQYYSGVEKYYIYDQMPSIKYPNMKSILKRSLSIDKKVN